MKNHLKLVFNVLPQKNLKKSVNSVKKLKKEVCNLQACLLFRSVICIMQQVKSKQNVSSQGSTAEISHFSLTLDILSIKQSVQYSYSVQSRQKRQLFCGLINT